MPSFNPKYDLERNVHRITLYNTVAVEHRHRTFKDRLYLHLDMNCFYAQVEQQSYDLYGIPLIVGGWRKPDGTPRGIVATSSYEARAFGVKTGMSAFEAVQKCPFLVFMQVHYTKYQAISATILGILKKHAMDVEKYSMDEYFADVSWLLKKDVSAIREFGAGLKKAIRDKTELICSVGIARSKTYAKLASDLQKPDGLVLILTDEAEQSMLWPLSLNEVWGIGSRRYAKLQSAGLQTIGDAVKSGPIPFQKLFGNMFGKMMHDTVTGKDMARILDNEQHVPEQVTYMHTFSTWTKDPWEVKGELIKAVRQLGYRMRGYSLRACKFVAYIRFQDSEWKGINVLFGTNGFTNIDDYLQEACLPAVMPRVVKAIEAGHRIRGIGIMTINVDASHQLELFFADQVKLSSLYKAKDHIVNQYGFEYLTSAAEMDDVKGKTHFLDR